MIHQFLAEMLSDSLSISLSMLVDRVIEHCPVVAANMSLSEAITLGYETTEGQALTIIVVESSIPIGLLTDRDIVRQIAINKNLEAVRVADAVTQPLVTLTRAEIKNISCVLEKFNHPIDFLLVLDDEGKIEGVITKANIISGLVNILLEQENNSILMQSIFETVSDGIFIYDLDTNSLVEANPAACKMHGYSYEELLSTPKTQYVHPDSHYLFDEFLKTVKQEHEYFTKAIGVRKNGTLFDGEVKGKIVKSHGRNFALYCVKDISASKRLEKALEKVKQRTEELAQMNAELARATRMKDEFLANMGHELRTPLNVILGLSEGLADEVYAPLPDKQKKAILNIQNCGQHLLELINDILDLVKIESGKLEVKKNCVDINSFLSNIHLVIHQQANKKAINLSFQISPDIDKVWFDEIRIHQVLINLLSNAVKFTAEKGKIKTTVDVDKEAKQIYFRVSDTGIGIDASNIHKLFQPFVQIDSSLSRNYSGTGLGLALVKKIIDMHDGSITVSSEVGRGSCFTVSLPYITAIDINHYQDTHTTTYKDTNNCQRLNPALILIADDNLINVELVVEFLTKSGYQIICALNGLEAVQLALQQKPDLIIMDIQMPHTDGLTAIKHIRHELKQVPVIALTALSSADKQQCIDAGADVFISKPFRLKHLDMVIKQLLDRSYTQS
ncbi:MAG: response regulator [Calothrix sp. C42_A2020_038]|nr:response regulator [Calothrix sp. C42_A2020_038]